MKTLPVLIVTALVAGFALAHAQELAPAATNSGTAATLPTNEGSLLPPLPTDSGLITYPQAAATPAPAPAEAASGTASTPTPPAAADLSKGSAEQLRQAIRIRELKTQVLEDPLVQEQKTGAQCAKTNAGRCVWMRNFYTLLYTKIEKIDPSLTVELESQLHDVLARYEQHHVRPSVLVECVKELPGSHSADHVSQSEKSDKSPEKPSKKKPKKSPFKL
jgi:hypothetical protein